MPNRRCPVGRAASRILLGRMMSLGMSPIESMFWAGAPRSSASDRDPRCAGCGAPGKVPLPGPPPPGCAQGKSGPKACGLPRRIRQQFRDPASRDRRCRQYRGRGTAGVRDCKRLSRATLRPDQPSSIFKRAAARSRICSRTCGLSWRLRASQSVRRSGSVRSGQRGGHGQKGRRERIA